MGTPKPIDWVETTLGEVIENYDYKRIPLNSRDRAKRQGIYPYYGASGIIDYIDDYIFDGRYLLIAEDGENLNSRKTPVAFFANGKFWVNNHAHIVRSIVGVSDDYFLMSYIQNMNISGYITGAAQPKLSQANLNSIKITLPPLPIQRRIADILSAYDNLIENNMQRIRILEQMAQAIYEEWFGMVDKESLPKGWELKPFSELVDIDPKTSVDKQIEKPFVGMNALSETSMIIDSSLIEMRAGNSGAKFQNRDVLFPRITPSVENGKGAFVQFLKDGQVSIGSTEIIVFREKELNAEYIYFLSREHEFRGNAINSMVGASGRQRVQQKCFDSFMVAKPPKKLLDKFADVVSPMFKITYTLALKNANLRQTRDLLLPRLVSGEIGITDKT